MTEDTLEMNVLCQVRSGQVRSECLTCTFRASRCSARLSRAQVPAFAGSSVQDRKQKKGDGVRGDRLHYYIIIIIIIIIIIMCV